MARRKRKSGRGGKPSRKRWLDRREERRKELAPGARYPTDPWDDKTWRFVGCVLLVLFLIAGIIAVWGIK